MDKILKLGYSDYSEFYNVHLNALPGKSPLSMNWDYSRWDYSQLFDYESFEFITGTTPFADLQVLLCLKLRYMVIKISWIAYFITIISLKIFMSNRQPFKLKYLTAIHNLILCIGSAGMFLAGFLGCVENYLDRGIGDVFWANDSKNRTGLQYWALYVFYLSKFYELLDTVILVLKKKNLIKKPIIFLHWYHHAIVMLMVWGWNEARLGFGVMGLLFNTGVHVFMYWYYFASNMGWNVWFKKYITTLQIIQFIGSFLITIPFIHYAKEGNFESWSTVILSSTVNFSFLCLFINFYFSSYKSKTKKAVKDSDEDSSDPLTRTNTPEMEIKSLEKVKSAAMESPVRRSPRRKK